jgi:hypothetical protein
MVRFDRFLAACAFAAIVSTGAAARAAPPTKEECVDAYSKGQDARESASLVQADKAFLLCAQAACPELVQRDCARFAEEVERLLPTVTLVARDAAQNDLPDTSVYVDGSLVASDLSDGKARPIDPGHHEVRFVHAGREAVIEVVVVQGEKGRALVGAFPSTEAPPAAGASSAGSSPAPPPRPAPAPARPAGPLVLVGIGAAAAVAGGVLATVGLLRMPSNCSLSAHDCAAPPGDPVFGKAGTSVALMNTGMIVGGAGLAVLGSGLVWYLAQPLRPAKVEAARLVPWAGPGGAGLLLRGTL